MMPSRFSFGCEPNATSTAANDFDAMHAAARWVAASWRKPTPTMKDESSDAYSSSQK